MGGKKSTAFLTRMDLDIAMLKEVSQRRRNNVWHPLHVESKKKWYKWTYLQNRNRLTDLENKLASYQGKNEEKWIIREFRINMYTWLYLKWIINKNLLYSTGNSAQCLEAAWMGGESGEEWIHGYVWLRPFAVHLKLSQHY